MHLPESNPSPESDNEGPETAPRAPGSESLVRVGSDATVTAFSNLLGQVEPLCVKPEQDSQQTRAQGPRDLFGFALSSGQQRAASRRKSSLVDGRPHPARARAPGDQPTLFDFLSRDSAANGREPPEPEETPVPLVPAAPPAEALDLPDPPVSRFELPTIASGEKAKAHDIIAAIRALKAIEQERRDATPEERQTLARFAGFGPVALSIFPDPLTDRYKDAPWQAVGEELKSLLTPEEYDSAKRTTFNAFYTSPTVIAAMHEAFARLGVPAGATVLEPLCGRPHNGSCVAQPVMWRRSSHSFHSAVSALFQAT